LKLATAKTNDNNTVLYASLDGHRYVRVEEVAAKPGYGWLRGVTDVKALMERRDDATTLLAQALENIEVDHGTSLELLELGPPIGHPRVIMCIGRNYPLHVAEGKADMPDRPLLFSKFSNTLIGQNGVVPFPSITKELDYEGELALVIGKRASRISELNAFEYIGGYTIINDISARDLQELDLQWIRGKSLDGFAPIGPVVVTTDEIIDVNQLRIVTTVNGEVRQDALCEEMHFKIPQLLAFITEGITLEPGDIVATGTPAGVGLGFDPPRYLRPGDNVTVTIEPIGSLSSIIGDVLR